MSTLEKEAAGPLDVLLSFSSLFLLLIEPSSSRPQLPSSLPLRVLRIISLAQESLLVH